MIAQSNKAGIVLMIATTLIFATQDGISRHLAETYNTFVVVMIRYWFFAAAVVVIAARQPGGFRATIATKQLGLQIFRGLLLAGEILVAVYGFTLIGLVDSHAIFASYPLMVAALAGPFLGEKAGWRRWLAISAGFVGMLIILQPGSGVFQAVAIIPLISAFMFAVYALTTRYAARQDTAVTSFFWTGVVGAVVTTITGVPNWEAMAGADAFWMLALCITGLMGHWLLIKCYEVAEASAVQPFAYFHLVFAVLIGIFVFGEAMETNVAIGAAVIVCAGVFTLWRAHVTAAKT